MWRRNRPIFFGDINLYDILITFHKAYIFGAGELEGTDEVVGTGDIEGTDELEGTGEVVWTGELEGTDEVVGTGELEGTGEAKEGIVVTAVVGAGVIEDSGQLNGARVEPATFLANGFPERSITGE